MSAKRIVIVGGGVVGVACTITSKKTGAEVTVIDQGRIGGGCSHGNCGYVSPSHILPFAGPGAIWYALKTLFQKNSPLKVRFRLSPALWGWFLRFARRCNRADMLEAGHAIDALLRTSRSLYDDLLRETGFDVEWETKGILFVMQTPAGMHHYEEVDRLLTEEFDRPAKRFDGAEMNEFEPALVPGLAGGYLYECDAILRRDRLMRSGASISPSRMYRFANSASFVDSRDQWPSRQRGRNIPGLDPRRCGRHRDRRLDSPLAQSSRRQGAHPARQRLFDDHAAANTLPEGAADLRGAPCRHFAVPERLPRRLDDGICRLRCPHEPRSLRAADRRGENVLCASRSPIRCRKNGGAGGPWCRTAKR